MEKSEDVDKTLKNDRLRIQNDFNDLMTETLKDLSLMGQDMNFCI